MVQLPRVTERFVQAELNAGHLGIGHPKKEAVIILLLWGPGLSLSMTLINQLISVNHSTATILKGHLGVRCVSLDCRPSLIG